MGVWSWIPWLLLLTDRVVRRPDPLTAAGLAAVVAAQFFTGHPESSFHALLATVAFFAFRLWQSRREDAGRRGQVRRRLVAFGAGLAGGAGLAAVSLVPLRSSSSGSRPTCTTGPASRSTGICRPRTSSGLFLPDFWGRPTQTPIRRIMFESALYVGALPLMLAAAALVLRPTAIRVAVAAFGGFWLAVVLGVPPLVQVVTRLPVFSAGHNTRLAIMTVLALALLAGWGLDELAARRPLHPGRRRAVVGSRAPCCVVPVLVVAVERPTGPGHAARSAARRVALRRPAGQPPRRPRRRRHRPVVARRLAHLRGRRAGARAPARPRPDRRWPRSRPPPWRSSAPTCSARGWASTRRSTASVAERAAHRRDQLPRAPAARALREHRRDPPERHPDATSASTRRAATTSRSSAATTGSGAVRSRRARAPSRRASSTSRCASASSRRARCARCACWACAHVLGRDVGAGAGAAAVEPAPARSAASKRRG